MTMIAGKYFKYGASLVLLILVGVSLFVYLKLVETPNCFVSDQPYKLSTKSIEGSQYALYAVISGFHEKSQVFYVLKEPVSFDECGYFEKAPEHSASPEIGGSAISVSEINVTGINEIEFKYVEGTIRLEDIKVNWLP
jgi:hypothetical protein